MAGKVSGGVRIEGLREKVKALEALGVDVSDLKAAFSAIARKGAEIAAAAAPFVSGALQRSIRGNKAKNTAIVTAGSAAKVPYAGPINFGWEARNIAASGFMQEVDVQLSPVAEREILDELDRLERRHGLT